MWTPRHRRTSFAATATAALVVLGLAAPAASARTAQAMTSGPLALGAYANGFTGSGSQISQFESMVGSHVAISSSFRGWGDLFPDAVQQQDAASGHTLLIAWDLGATSATRFTTFTTHQHDDYLAAEAAAAHNFGATFYVRPWAEMNGDWNPFQPTADGSQPAGGTYSQFIAAWRYIVTFFRNHGASNVKWVFNPTTDTYSGTTPVSKIWPGASYVNVMGLDGYNWGTGGIFTWRTFSNIYTTQYQRLVALSSTLPVWICEFGSKEPTEDDGAPIDPSNSKATWYSDAWSYLSSTMTHVRAAVLFDVSKERDWRIESDSAALAQFQTLATQAAPTV